MRSACGLAIWLLGSGLVASEPAVPRPAGSPDLRVGALLEALLEPESDADRRSKRRVAVREELAGLGAAALPELRRHSVDERFRVRWEVVNALGNMALPGGQSVLVDRILRDENLHVRWRATWALSTLGSRADLSELRAALAGEGPFAWRATVALSLVAPEPSLVPRLEAGLDSADAWLRWEAVDALGRVHGSSTASLLAARLDDEDGRVRREAAMSLGEIDDAAARAQLLTALEHADRQVRWRAAMKLGPPRTAAEAESMRQRLQRETDAEARKYLRQHLGS